MTAFRAPLVEEKLPLLHGESTRGIFGGGTLPRPKKCPPDTFYTSLRTGADLFESRLQKKTLSTLHGESTRGEGMPLSYKITAPEARTKKRDTQRVSLFLVPVVGLEPTRCRHQRILSPSRLPIPSHRRVNRDIIADAEEKCKDYFFFLWESLHKIQKVGLPNGRKMWYNKQNYAQ